jgi:hypothetical protein
LAAYTELIVDVIDQLRSSRASKLLRLFEPIKLHLQPPYLREELRLLDLGSLLFLGLLAP